MERLAARGAARPLHTFAVTVDGITRETGDPYARAAGVNGVRSMIVDLARTAPSGWERDVRPTIPPAQRAVWEVSVRDFSQDAASGVRPAWRGKYMAFTQQGTTLHGDGIHPTCLNYLKRLGDVSLFRFISSDVKPQE